LGVLALHAGAVVSFDRLIDQLWGQAPPPTATKALHGLVSTLRKRLGPPDDGTTPQVLETRAPGYLLAIDRDQVDANRFRRLVAEATQAPVATKAAWLREALGLWRGPALDEFAYEPFAQAAIAELEELRLAALEERVEADLALGRHAELVAELEGLVAEHPLRERLRAQLMLALYRCGRQVDALELYRVRASSTHGRYRTWPTHSCAGLACRSHDPPGTTQNRFNYVERTTRRGRSTVGLWDASALDLRTLQPRLLADCRGPALDEGEQLMAHLLRCHRAVDECGEEGAPDTAAEAVDLLGGALGQRIGQRSGARLQATFDTGLDVVPGTSTSNSGPSRAEASRSCCRSLQVASAALAIGGNRPRARQPGR